MRYPKGFIVSFLIGLLFVAPALAKGFQMGGNPNDGNHPFDNLRNRWNDGMDNMHQRQEAHRDRWQEGWNNMRERQQNRHEHMRDNWNRWHDHISRTRDNWNDMRNYGGQYKGRHH